MSDLSKDERKAALASYMREYTRKNREKINEARRLRYKKDPKKVIVSNNKYKSKDCVKEKLKTYFKSYSSDPKNKERRKELSRRAESLIKKREADILYRKENALKIKQQKSEYYFINKQYVIDRNREWRGNNPDKILSKNQRRRAHKNNVEVKFVDPKFIYARDNGFCKLCGGNVDVASMTIDHIIPLSKGGSHTEENLQLAHRGCNSKKGNRIIN